MASSRRSASRRSVLKGTAAAAVLLVSSIVLSWCSVEVFAVTRPEDVSAINELATTWSAAARLNWSGDPCDNSWDGIMCNHSTNTSTIIQLNLEDRALNGTLPSAVGGLTNLQVLELSRNSGLNGQLPVELGELTQLIRLSLQWCSFNGPIPGELGNLLHLSFLGLNGNHLSGGIPRAFGNLVNLTWLDISNNSLSGPLPVSSSTDSGGIGLDNMTLVNHFHFNDNELSGSIPPEIFSLPYLRHLILDHNKFESSIPTVISNLGTLTIVRLDNNNFSGEIPEELGSRELQRIVNLNLQNNQFSGLLPDLSNLSALQLLDVSGNQFSAQELPAWISNMSNLQTLNLAHSNFLGQMRPEFFRLSQIQSLNLSQNQLSGTLAFDGVTSPALQVVDVMRNNITGVAGEPESPQGTFLNVSIILEGNPLCNNTFLDFPTHACGTRTAGAYNGWLRSSNTTCGTTQCKNEKMLNPKTCACGYPWQIDLTFTGPTFSFLTDGTATQIEEYIATNLTKIGREDNTASILNIDPQQVVIDSGDLQYDQRYLLHLHFFALRGDSLSQQEGSDIRNALNQRRFNLSEGPWQVPMTIRIEGGSDDSANLSAGAIAGIVVGVSAFVLLVVAYAVRQKILADRAEKRHPFASWGGGSKEFGEAPELKGARWCSLAELKTATNNWSEQNEIGEGTYGKVYKGVLQSGDAVAIKRAREGSLQGAAEFKDKIELLSRMHHRNLVGLVGFYYDAGEQALIYELMSNGALLDHLGGAYPPLSWQTRMTIALGSARGLAYLHDYAEPAIIHGDVKSANILLNERQVAKFADFGMSKLAPDKGVKGTSGYLDPEYHITHQLTDKSDVYSFGVILLELVTAKVPIENVRSVVHKFLVFLDRSSSTELRELLDPVLKDLSKAELEAYLKIAFGCVEESSMNRPRMNGIVKELERLGGHSYSNSGVDRLRTDSGQREKPINRHNVTDVEDQRSKATSQAEDNDPSFQYSGALGVSQSVLPK